MPEFIMNKEGRVECSDPHSPCVCAFATFEQLPDVAKGFFEAMFFTDNAPGYYTETVLNDPNELEDMGENGSFPEDSDYGDLHSSTVARGVADCIEFETFARVLLDRAAERGYTREQAGRDFWFTRNGHGVGFSDRDELRHPEDGPERDEYERLTALMVAKGTTPDEWQAALDKRNALEAESLASKLEELAKKYPELDSTFGDDGKIYY